MRLRPLLARPAAIVTEADPPVVYIDAELTAAFFNGSLLSLPWVIDSVAPLTGAAPDTVTTTTA